MFVFRNYTVENLFPSDTLFSGYGDISDISSEKDLIWFYQVPINFNSVQRLEEVKSFRDKIDIILRQLKPYQKLWICSLMDFFPIHSIDTDNELKQQIADFNQYSLTLAKEHTNIRFIDVSEYFYKYPSYEWINWKYYFISQMIVNPKIATGFSKWFSKRISQISGPRKKCVVLDLDNTIWGGVLGEDGIEGIKIGGDYPGNAFLYFQEALIDLSKQGVILAVCSKNNEKDVLEAWNKNPFIKLNKKYISSYRINWNNKADNLREIAKELNIGLDSLVFVDDNPTERELIKQELPMVSVPDFPSKPYQLMEFYKSLVEKYFRTYLLTEEDKNKTEQYKANAARNVEKSNFTNLEDYIKSLNIELEITPANKFNIPRIAQMTQKTNQFNLTTQRYSEADIEAFVKNGDFVYCLSVKDKFGDNGITGLIILTNNNDHSAEIDTFLLSCRILGKGIENIFLNSILNLLYEKGYDYVISSYIETAKNHQVEFFYDKNNFSCTATDCNKKLYQLMLKDRKPVLNYYKIKIKNQ